jgi:DNA polymerase I-like protein with 3'-5' exonuclease and polymerase domains
VADVEALRTAAASATLIGCDVETSGGGQSAFITCAGYACWGKDGKLSTFVVPFAAPYKEGGRYWETETDELRVFDLLREVHQTQALKVMQNGAYDSHYYIAYRLPLRNYLFDTANAFHAIWPESPKRLDWVASFCCDYYTYWKDEGKEAKDDNKGEIKVPQTQEGCERYWRYNALDCHYTALSSRPLLALLLHPNNKWALQNFVEEFRAQLGPALRMSLTGALVNRDIQAKLSADNIDKHIRALDTLRYMVNDQEYNPNSPHQTSSLIYDVLRATELKRKGRTVDEKVLKVIETQSPILFHVIEQIWKTKKPANNVSKYGSGNLRLLNNRWMYVMNAAGTETWRYASKKSHFWVGTQIQNVPYSVRPVIEADKGYVLFDADYAQSDAFFTAFESEEPTYMKNVLDDRDTHCVHAAQFFQRDYDELLKGYLADDPAITHSTKGIRQMTKRVTYGANYLMAAFTLFMTMGGKPPVVAAAQALGYDDAPSWTDAKLVHFCQRMLDFYFNKMYPGLLPWIQEEVQRAIRNGNRATCAFGKTRTFFGNLNNDSAAQRELAAFFGQGGTAGNINTALENIHYKSPFYSEGGIILFQVHDSIVGQIPEDKLDLLSVIHACMDNECEVKGRTFRVPVEIKVGRGWGKRMVKYKKDATTLADIDSFDAQWMEKNGYAESKADAANNWANRLSA